MSMSIYITGMRFLLYSKKKKKKEKKSFTFWQTYIAILYNSFYFIINIVIIIIIIVPFILDNDRSNIDQWTLIKELTNFQSHMWRKKEKKKDKKDIRVSRQKGGAESW